ncbi:hypothetical protein PMSD_23455 [Paenibacillus macquariensis subsp. defensor]|nr:hypothetical protein PMSD_23455 [Paenibacillus macquariensis subsp. defensor]
MMLFYWDSNDTLIRSLYYKGPFIELSSMLREKQNHMEPKSIRVGKKTYRFVSRPYQGNLPFVEELSNTPLKTVQIYTEISAQAYSSRVGCGTTVIIHFPVIS